MRGGIAVCHQEVSLAGCIVRGRRRQLRGDAGAVAVDAGGRRALLAAADRNPDVRRSRSARRDDRVRAADEHRQVGCIGGARRKRHLERAVRDAREERGQDGVFVFVVGPAVEREHLALVGRVVRGGVAEAGRGVAAALGHAEFIRALVLLVVGEKRERCRAAEVGVRIAVVCGLDDERVVFEVGWSEDLPRRGVLECDRLADARREGDSVDAARRARLLHILHEALAFARELHRAARVFHHVATVDVGRILRRPAVRRRDVRVFPVERLLHFEPGGVFEFLSPVLVRRGHRIPSREIEHPRLRLGRGAALGAVGVGVRAGEVGVVGVVPVVEVLVVGVDDAERAGGVFDLEEDVARRVVEFDRPPDVLVGADHIAGERDGGIGLGPVPEVRRALPGGSLDASFFVGLGYVVERDGADAEAHRAGSAGLCLVCAAPHVDAGKLHRDCIRDAAQDRLEHHAFVVALRFAQADEPIRAEGVERGGGVAGVRHRARFFSVGADAEARARVVDVGVERRVERSLVPKLDIARRVGGERERHSGLERIARQAHFLPVARGLVGVAPAVVEGRGGDECGRIDVRRRVRPERRLRGAVDGIAHRRELGRERPFPAEHLVAAARLVEPRAERRQVCAHRRIRNFDVVDEDEARRVRITGDGRRPAQPEAARRGRVHSRIDAVEVGIRRPGRLRKSEFVRRKGLCKRLRIALEDRHLHRFPVGERPAVRLAGDDRHFQRVGVDYRRRREHLVHVLVARYRAFDHLAAGVYYIRRDFKDERISRAVFRRPAIHRIEVDRADAVRVARRIDGGALNVAHEQVRTLRLQPLRSYRRRRERRARRRPRKVVLVVHQRQCRIVSIADTHIGEFPNLRCSAEFVDGVRATEDMVGVGCRVWPAIEAVDCAVVRPVCIVEGGVCPVVALACNFAIVVCEEDAAGERRRPRSADKAGIRARKLYEEHDLGRELAPVAVFPFARVGLEDERVATVVGRDDAALVDVARGVHDIPI